MTKEEKAEYNAAYHRRNKIRIAAKKRAYREANRAEIAAQQRDYREANPEKVAASQKRWQEANREKVAASQKRWQEANPEKVVASKKRWQEANREKVVASNKRWQEANPEKVVASKKRWQEANPGKVRAIQRAYDRRNPHKRAAREHKRRAAKLNATPIWAADVHQHVAQLALLRGPDQHIDHEVPLRGRLYSTHPIQLVCGLHTVGNLKLISAAENLSKGCSEWPDMWSYTPAHMSELALLWQPYSPVRSALRMKAYV